MPFYDRNLNTHIVWAFGQYRQSNKSQISNSLFFSCSRRTYGNDKLLRLSELISNLIDHTVLAFPLSRDSPSPSHDSSKRLFEKRIFSQPRNPQTKYEYCGKRERKIQVVGMWFTHKDKFAARRNLIHNIPSKYPHPNTIYPVFNESRNWTIV